MTRDSNRHKGTRAPGTTKFLVNLWVFVASCLLLFAITYAVEDGADSYVYHEPSTVNSIPILNIDVRSLSVYYI